MFRYSHRLSLLVFAIVILTACGQAATSLRRRSPISTLLPYPPPLAFPTLIPLPQGYIPLPTPTPWPTITPGPSLTPFPTWTPLPTPTPTSLPTIVPPIQTATAGRLPQLTRDLLFLDNGRLMRWNHTTGQIETLAGPGEAGYSPAVQNPAFKAGGLLPGDVLRFSASADGQKVALVRVAGTDASGWTQELALLDLNTLRTKSLILVERDLLGISISPDGAWVAYIPQDLPPIEPTSTPFPTQTPPPLPTSYASSPIVLLAYEVGLTAPVEHPPIGVGPQSGTIYSVRADAPGQRVEVGYCAKEISLEQRRGCNGFLWSPDSYTIVWSDAHGVWLVELDQAAPRLLVAHEVEKCCRVYQPSAWSPSGRYILGWVGHYEGSSRVLLDPQTGEVRDVPNTFRYGGPSTEVIWTDDGRLLMATPGNPPVIGIWHIGAANDASMALDKSFPVNVSAENIPAAPMQLENGYFAFVLWNASSTDYQPRGLYIFDPTADIPRKMNGLPPVSRDYFSADVIWSPDGSGAIYSDWDTGSLLYIPTDGSALYDLRPVLGDHVCCFTWVE